MRHALVAGGTGRVGRAIADRLEAGGWSVLAAGRADGDLRTAAGAHALVAQALSQLGALELVVHAAADPFVRQHFADVSEQNFNDAFGVTTTGTFFLAQAAAPSLQKSGGAYVVIEDVAAYEPWPGFAAHSAAKAAQAMLVRTLAVALAPGVRVCGVAPGAVAIGAEDEERQASRTLLGRTGSTEDVAAAVAYLADAGFVTGTTLVVDGGRLAKSAGPASP
ncbi:MAG TPA: SDR family oxidoreductase [Gaiellaceae bacterium]